MKEIKEIEEVRRDVIRFTDYEYVAMKEYKVTKDEIMRLRNRVAKQKAAKLRKELKDMNLEDKGLIFVVAKKIGLGALQIAAMALTQVGVAYVSNKGKTNFTEGTSQGVKLGMNMFKEHS